MFLELHVLGAKGEHLMADLRALCALLECQAMPAGMEPISGESTEPGACRKYSLDTKGRAVPTSWYQSISHFHCESWGCSCKVNLRAAAAAADPAKGRL